MNNKDLLRRKLEYATPEEVLFIFLNDTDVKFKKVIELWKNNSVEGTILAGKLQENIIELKSTLNTEIGDEKSKEALRTISSLYTFIIDEIMISSLRRDYERLDKAYKVFLNIKNIFEEDRKNIK